MNVKHFVVNQEDIHYYWPMRLFVTSGIFHPESGGPATYLYHFLPELIQQGHEVSVLTFGNPALDQPYPYPITRIPRRNPIWNEVAYLSVSQRLWGHYDLAYVHSLGVPLAPSIRPRVGKIVGDQAWERATRRGWVPAGTDIDTFQQTRYGPRVEMAKRLRSERARRFDHVIVPSEHRRMIVSGWGIPEDRVSVIYNALPPTFTAPELSQEEARQQLNLPNEPTLLTVARLTPLKNIDLTLRALAGVSDIRLVIAGDGHIRDELEGLSDSLGLKERVDFRGKVPHEQLNLYYRAADYTLLFSGGEGLSHVLLESLKVGTPIIASDSGGNPEVVIDQVNGFKVETGNIQQLESTFQQAYRGDTPKRLKQGTGKGYEKFEWSTMVDQTIQVLKQFA